VLSVVIPVYNEARDLPATIDALLTAVSGSGFDAEVVLVDDGSTDESVSVARNAIDGRVPVHVLSQPNRGRFEARRMGLDAARGDDVLLLDARVRIHPDALAYVREQITRGRDVWTAHVDVEDEGNPYGAFWKLIAELAWSEYFDDPRDTSFGIDDFDHFPKGTTCFFAPRSLVRDAVAAFRSKYSDVRRANDDTPFLRWIAERRPINVSPGFRCTYRPRGDLEAFLRHSFHRGVVFVDGHGRPESRFFPVVGAFYPASLMLALAAVRRPSVVAAAAGVVSIAAATFGVARGRSRFEVGSLAALAPLYAAAHGAGMWRGLALWLGNAADDR
jgi:glycosyltransferase involved in cell wall biosynthesis